MHNSHEERPRLLEGIEQRIHAVSLRALDLTPEDRTRVVHDMFTRRRRDVVSYWLQLLLSMAIATVGLVLGSTAVVIGAMLIAPLMGPIVELGMGLMVGSAVLTLRSFARMVGSVLVAIAGAALLTMLLPFQEITSEIASRTSPTALDLVLAILVAIAAAYTTARPGFDTTGAAAGTAIGIALIPPLCVTGFGLGIQSPEIASGASLMFLTNLTAILLVSVLFFWCLGFETVDATEWEVAAIAEAPEDGLVRRVTDMLRALFGSRYSRVLRVGLPLVLVAAVFLPLSRALEQVAWEVRARSAVSRIMDEALASRSSVQSEVSVAPGAVSTRLYMVGSAEDAAVLERELVARIAAATGVVPTVRVVAVPNAESMRQAAGARDAAATAPPELQLAEIRQRLDTAVRGTWPVAELGPLLGWRLEMPDSAVPRLVIDHLGEPGGPAADALLARVINERSGTALGVTTIARSPAVLQAPAAEGAQWLPSLARILDMVRASDRLRACVTIPEATLIQRDASLARVAEQVESQARPLAAGRVAIDTAGAVWRVGLSHAPCARADGATTAIDPGS